MLTNILHTDTTDLPPTSTPTQSNSQTIPRDATPRSKRRDTWRLYGEENYGPGTDNEAAGTSKEEEHKEDVMRRELTRRRKNKALDGFVIFILVVFGLWGAAGLFFEVILPCWEKRQDRKEEASGGLPPSTGIPAAAR